MRRNGPLLIVAILLVAGLGFLIWRYVTWPRADQRLELLAARNVALGHLENGEYDAALQGLEKIIKAMPNEPLGRRNAVLALFKPSDAGDTTVGQAAYDPVLKATQEMLAVEPDAAAAHHLAARVYLGQSNLLRGKPGDEAERALDEARKSLRRAAQLAPNDPAPLYELYEIEKRYGDPDQPLSEEAFTALRAAVGLAPNNLPCLVDWLEELAHRNDPQAKTVLEQILRLLDPAEPGQRAGPREELEALRPILAANPKPLPPEFHQKLTSARNLLQKDSATYQQERVHVHPHPLAFVLQDFRPDFYVNLPPEPVEEVFVRFETFSPTGLDKLPGVVGAAWEDVTSTGGFTVIMVRRQDDKTVVEVGAKTGEAAFPPIAIQGDFRHAIPADLDLDIRPMGDRNVPADLDLVLFGPDGIRILENTEEIGRRRWVERADVKLPEMRNVQWVLVFDVDQDGNLDLVVGLEKGIRLLRNSGAWSFEDVTSRTAGLEDLATVAATFGDFDRDGDPDVLVVGKDGQLTLLSNLRGGQFAVVPTGIHLDGAASIAAGDVDNDGLLDVVLGRPDGITYLRNTPAKPGHFARTDQRSGGPVAQVGFIDYDNDGFLDVWARGAGAGQPLSFWHNERSERLVEAVGIVSEQPPVLRHALVADVDNDGDMDLILVTDGGVLGLRNQGGNKNNWLRLRLQAQLNRDTNVGAAAKSNFFNVGGTLEVKAGRHYQLQQVGGSLTHFGLGGRSQADVARIVWTNGVPQVVIRPQTNQILTEEQKPKGSCPFLFSWDGTKYVWITDCLWSSALGMKLAHGVYMDHERQENYLIIPGDRCQPKEGKYVLQFTNELWEVPYLDQVELWAVDHPADVDVYTNQKVPPDAKEAFRFITARSKRTPVAARDHQGRDVLAIVRERDHDYLGGFTRRRYVGLAEPHWLELDLGDLSAAKEATLFLTGWIWPTDTTGNVAISLDPRFRGPTGVVGGVQPPSLLVPDGNGGWKVAIPMMGFQSGKLQTVAVPLPLAEFPKGDYRLRISTSMELYWDEAFFTADDGQAAFEVKKLPVASADLHYRGYSRTWQACRTSPHLYDYEAVDAAPRWLPIPGPYTRYGDVTPVLRQSDSQVVIMSPGDELTLAFDALPPPAPGRKRTFAFYGNGWLKDFDVNGGASDGVLPLPFVGMTRYPHEDPYPAQLEAFRREYLTRHSAGEGFYGHLLDASERRQAFLRMPREQGAE